jgi:hypothetical protein
MASPVQSPMTKSQSRKFDQSRSNRLIKHTDSNCQYDDSNWRISWIRFRDSSSQVLVAGLPVFQLTVQPSRKGRFGGQGASLCGSNQLLRNRDLRGEYVQNRFHFSICIVSCSGLASVRGCGRSATILVRLVRVQRRRHTCWRLLFVARLEWARVQDSSRKRPRSRQENLGQEWGPSRYRTI